MGGKTSTSTSQTTVPQDVLNRYDAVNSAAENLAGTPFQQYSTNPNAFVAPINAQQSAGIGTTNAATTAAQPYNAAATAYTLGGSQAVNPTALTGSDINQYLSPYLGDVAESTEQLQNQSNQQQQEGALGEAINQGAFGGDRAGIAAANLEQQQNLENSSVLSGLLNTGYNTALSTAQQQQGVGLDAAQANRAALQQTGATLGTLGQTVQGEGLAAGSAQQAAGATEQQTQQAGLSALYNQFEQQQSYPFQVAQFEANIAEGTGALSGSTTTSTQPQSIFSDERLKEDVHTIGKTFGGQNVVAFRYKGDPTTRIGLIAQDVEKRHPEAVREVAGFKAVDYDKATEADARKGHFYKGGVVPANDRAEYAFGGTTLMDPQELAMLEGQASGTYGPYAAGGLYGSAGAGARGYVPTANLPVGRLMTSAPPPQRPSMLSQGMGAANQLTSLGTSLSHAAMSPAATSALGSLGMFNKGSGSIPPDYLTDGGGGDIPSFRAGGEVRPHRDLGGIIDGDDDDGGAGPAPEMGTMGPSLDIPDEAPHITPLKPATIPGQGGGGGSNTLGDIASIGSTIAKILPFIPMASGGAITDDLAGLQDPADANAQSVLKSLLNQSDTLEPDDTDDAPSAPPVPGAPARGGGLSIATSPGVPVSASFAGSGSPKSPTALGSLAGSQTGADASSLPTVLQQALKGIYGAEGTAHNPTPGASAQGPYQITNGTFTNVFRQMFPQRASGMSRQDILALRSTPEGNDLSLQMGPYLAKQYATTLSSGGFPITPGNIYLMHFLGPEATKVLQADPSTPVSQVLKPADITMNERVLGGGKTVGDLLNWTATTVAKHMPHQRGGSVGRTTRARGGFADGGSPDDTTDPTPPPAPTALSDADTAGTLDAAAVAPGNITPQPLNHDPAAAPVPPKKSFADNLKDPGVFIPILTGLAAAASVPTVHPLMAIAEGLGAGAQAYQGQREYQLQQQQVAQHGQEVNVLQSAQALEPQRIAAVQAEAGAHVLTAKANLLSNALSIFNSQYTPIAQIGPDGVPMYKDPYGRAMSATDVGQARQAYINQVLGTAGGASAASLPNPIGGSNAPASPSAVPAPVGGSGGPAPGPAVSGNGPVPPGLGAPAPNGVGVAPAAVHPQARALPANATVAQKVQAGVYAGAPVQIPQPTSAGLSQSDDPVYLKQQGMGLAQMGNPDQQAAGQRMIERANGIENGSIIPNDATGAPDSRYVNYQQAIGQQKAVNDSYAQAKIQKNQAASDFASQMPATFQLQNSLIKLYQDYNTNRLTPDLADIVGKASSIPGLSALVQPQWEQYQSTNDTAVKETARQAIVQAVASHIAAGAPASALTQANKTVPQPTMAPGARYTIAAQQAALLKQEQDYYGDWEANKGQVNDVAKYDTDWVAQHPIGKYEQWAYNTIAPFAGMTDQEKAAHPRQVASPADVQSLPPHTPFLIPSGPNKGKIGWSS